MIFNDNGKNADNHIKSNVGPLFNAFDHNII